MKTPTLKLYPSATLKSKNDNLEQRLEKIIIDVYNIHNSSNNIKETIAYLKDKNDESEKK